MSTALRPQPLDTAPDAAQPLAERRIPGALAIVIAMALMFANYGPATVFGLLVPKPTRDQSLAVSLLLQFTPMVLVSAAAVLFVAVVLRFVHRLPLRASGLRWSALTIPQLLVGMLIVAVPVVTAALAMRGSDLVRTTTGTLGNGPLWAIVLGGIMMAFVMQGFPEELIFRGYLMRVLPWRNKWVLATASTLSFGVLHLVSSGGQESMLEHLTYLAVPIGFGFLAAALTIVTGNIWAAVGVHGGNHIATYVVYATIGVQSGSALWLLQGGLTLAIGIGVLAFAYQKTDVPAA